MVENALLADSALRDIGGGVSNAFAVHCIHLRRYVASTVQFAPAIYVQHYGKDSTASRGCGGPDDHHSKSGSPVVDRVQLADQASDFSVANSKRLTTMSSVYSIRTLVEVLVATVAVVLIVLKLANPRFPSPAEQANRWSTMCNFQ